MKIPDVTKNDPSGCIKRALPDEPVFTLLARDPLAPALVRSWANQRETSGSPEQQWVASGKEAQWVTPSHPDAETIAHARYCAARMEVWRYENEGDDKTEATWRAAHIPGGDRDQASDAAIEREAEADRLWTQGDKQP